jgi:hypothetical protein
MINSKSFSVIDYVKSTDSVIEKNCNPRTKTTSESPKACLLILTSTFGYSLTQNIKEKNKCRQTQVNQTTKILKFGADV